MPSETQWDEFAVWNKNGRWYICHAIDGDDGIGPFPSERDAANALRALRAAHQERDADARRLAKLREKLERIALCDQPVDYSDRAHRCTWRVQAERAAQIARDSLANDRRAAIDAAMAADTQTEGESDGR